MKATDLNFATNVTTANCMRDLLHFNFTCCVLFLIIHDTINKMNNKSEEQSWTD